jgi:MerR family transcriptional regulator, light-induced transcriptional regulator
MPSTPSQRSPRPERAAASGLPIAAVEQETGLGKDTLRAWERRYGFPTPARDATGDRRYARSQVEHLKLIGRLLNAGLRPGKLMGLDRAGLKSLLAGQAGCAQTSLSRTKPTEAPADPAIRESLDAIGQHDATALRHSLRHAQSRLGLAAFVTEVAAPLTAAVGHAWASGKFEIFEEHLFTEMLGGVLRGAIASLPPRPAPAGPRVLLTTVVREPHGLGLLMVEALLALEGCTCVSLGTQTPQKEIVRAARAHHADVVALSFTDVHRKAAVLSSLRELRSGLPAATALWVGGACAALYPSAVAGVQAVQHLTALADLVAQWRSSSEAGA